MAIDVSNLTVCPYKQAEIFGLTVRQRSILDSFPYHTNYPPGAFTYRYYDADVEFGACCQENESDGTFNEADGYIGCFNTRLYWCPADLAAALNDFAFRYNLDADPNNSELIELFTREMLAGASVAINNILINGDRTSGTGQLALIDGILAQSPAPVATTAENLYDAIIEAYLALPEQAKQIASTPGADSGIVVLVPTGWEVLLSLRLDERFGRPVVDRQYDVNMSFPGLPNVTVIPTAGLTNTIIVTPKRNVHWFTNLRRDLDFIHYDKCNCPTTRYYLEMEFLLGILVLIQEWVVVMTVSDEVANSKICTQVCVSDTTTTAIKINDGGLVDVDQLAQIVSATVKALSSNVSVEDAVAEDVTIKRGRKPKTVDNTTAESEDITIKNES